MAIAIPTLSGTKTGKSVSLDAWKTFKDGEKLRTFGKLSPADKEAAATHEGQTVAELSAMAKKVPAMSAALTRKAGEGALLLAELDAMLDGGWISTAKYGELKPLVKAPAAPAAPVTAKGK